VKISNPACVLEGGQSEHRAFQPAISMAGNITFQILPPTFYLLKKMPLNLSSQVAAANALPYATAPFSIGLTGEDFRDLHIDHAQRVRWWKAVEMPKGAAGVGLSGIRYFEQILGGCLITYKFSNERQLDEDEFGKIRVGDVRFSAMPDEIELSSGDRILAIDSPKIAASVLRVNDDSEATLPRLHIAGVETVYDAAGVVIPNNYEVLDRVIRWVGSGAAPDEISVRYRFYPMYEFRGENENQAFVGTDGKRLPQIVPLDLLAEGEEND